MISREKKKMVEENRRHAGGIPLKAISKNYLNNVRDDDLMFQLVLVESNNALEDSQKCTARTACLDD
jgi:hypothetical protein